MDNKLLDYYINESGLKIKAIADRLNLTYVGFHYKCMGKRKFTLEELDKLKVILNIPDNDFEEVIDNAVIRAPKKSIGSK